MWVNENVNERNCFRMKWNEKRKNSRQNRNEANKKTRRSIDFYEQRKKMQSMQIKINKLIDWFGFTVLSFAYARARAHEHTPFRFAACGLRPKAIEWICHANRARWHFHSWTFCPPHLFFCCCFASAYDVNVVSASVTFMRISIMAFNVRTLLARNFVSVSLWRNKNSE